MKPRPDSTTFFTPDLLSSEQTDRLESARGRLLIAACRSGRRLADKVVAQYEKLWGEAGESGRVLYLPDVDFQFSDSETCVRLELDASGHDVFLMQSLYDPTSERSVDENYQAFLISARAFKEWGANQVVGILPYLAYARQDKPTKYQQEPTTAKLMADFTIEAGIDRLAVWHPHQSHIHGFYGRLPIDVPEPLFLFLDEFRHLAEREDVIVVAPDVGASKFVTHVSRALHLKSAIASKYRPRPEESSVSEIIGNFQGKHIALVLDDMIGSGGTVEALIKKLVTDKGIKEIYVGVSHNLGMPQAQERMLNLHRHYNLQQMIVTDSIPQTDVFAALPFVTVKDLSDPLSRMINRIHYNRSVHDLFKPQRLA